MTPAWRIMALVVRKAFTLRQKKSTTSVRNRVANYTTVVSLFGPLIAADFRSWLDVQGSASPRAPIAAFAD